MELNKDRGPIYSNYDRDRSRDYSPVIDYAAPPRSREEMEFMLAHKIAPDVAELGDMRPAAVKDTSRAQRLFPPSCSLCPTRWCSGRGVRPGISRALHSRRRRGHTRAGLHAEISLRARQP